MNPQIKATQQRILNAYQETVDAVKSLGPLEVKETLAECDKRKNDPVFSVRTAAEIVRAAILMQRDLADS